MLYYILHIGIRILALLAGRKVQTAECRGRSVSSASQDRVIPQWKLRETNPELTGWESHRDDHDPGARRLWNMDETRQSHPLQPANGPLYDTFRRTEVYGHREM